MIKALCILLALSVVAGFAGCQDEKANGALYLTWKFGAFTCDEADVMEVHARLYSYEDSSAVVESRDNCSANGLQLPDVPPGEYTLLLQGLNADGCATHEVRRDITVPEGTVNRVDELALLRRHRDLVANWYFDNRLDCLGNGVKQVEIQVSVGDRFDQTFLSLCEGFQTTISEKLPVGDIRLAVRGLDDEGNSIAFGTVEYDRDVVFQMPCEDVVKLEVPLSMCNLIDCETVD